jgi:hypothetical protein
VLREVAAEKGALLVDARRVIRKRAKHYDGESKVHLSPEGSRVLADVLARELRPIVERRKHESAFLCGREG